MTGHLAILDGDVIDVARAQIPVTDEGLLRGDGVFEVVRLYDGAPYGLEEHLERMQRSAATLRLPFDIDAVRDDAERLLEASAPADGALRLLVTRGGRGSRAPRRRCRPGRGTRTPRSRGPASCAAARRCEPDPQRA